MRTYEQISRVAALLNLSRRQKSILEWKKNHFKDQYHLLLCAKEIRKLNDFECLELLNGRGPSVVKLKNLPSEIIKRKLSTGKIISSSSIKKRFFSFSTNKSLHF